MRKMICVMMMLVLLVSMTCSTAYAYRIMDLTDYEPAPGGLDLTLFIPDRSNCNYRINNDGSMTFKVQVANSSSTKSVVWYSVFVFVESRGGTTYPDEEYVFYFTNNNRINPRKVVYTDNMTIPRAPTFSTHKLYVSIGEVKFSDGSMEYGENFKQWVFN